MKHFDSIYKRTVNELNSRLGNIQINVRCLKLFLAILALLMFTLIGVVVFFAVFGKFQVQTESWPDNCPPLVIIMSVCSKNTPCQVKISRF